MYIPTSDTLQARTIRRVFEDDNRRTNTKTLSNVIETVQILVDCISGIVDAWESFNHTEIALFTKHAPEKLVWPDILMRISRNIAELDRLRKLLLTKRDRFKFKLDSVRLPLVLVMEETDRNQLHTVSSLSQTETANLQATTAVSQGHDLRMLTKMTVVCFLSAGDTTYFSQADTS